MASKSLRLFSQEEKKFLSKLVSLPVKAKFPADIVEEFCRKFDRKPVAVYQFVQRERRRLNVQPPVSPIVAPTKDLTTLRRNEFVIPVTNWELRSENGHTNLILKFK
jgi:hypothetical protein